MPKTLLTASILVMAAAVATSACSEETDETEVRVDAGTDTATTDDDRGDDEMPTVDSIDAEQPEPAETRRIRIEAAEQAGIIPESPPLGAESYLDSDRAADLFDDDQLDTAPIAGQASSEHHNSVRYLPAETDDRFGVGLQIWDLTDQQTEPADRLAELREQFIAVDQLEDDRLNGAFTSRRAGIRNLVFAGDSEPYVFILSCDTETCEDLDELTEMAADIAADH